MLGNSCLHNAPTDEAAPFICESATVLDNPGVDTVVMSLLASIKECIEIGSLIASLRHNLEKEMGVLLRA